MPSNTALLTRRKKINFTKSVMLVYLIMLACVLAKKRIAIFIEATTKTVTKSLDAYSSGILKLNLKKYADIIEKITISKSMFNMIHDGTNLLDIVNLIFPMCSVYINANINVIKKLQKVQNLCN